MREPSLGNASHSSVRNVTSTRNAGDGFHNVGRHINNATWDTCDASSNGGWGFYDESLTGNTYISCQMNGNNLILAASADATVGSFKTVGGSNATQIINCYAEAIFGYKSELTGTVIVQGGQYASEIFHPEANDVFIWTAGRASRRAFSALNTLGDTNVSSGIGRNPSNSADNIVLWFGSVDKSATMDQVTIRYVLSGSRYGLQYGGNTILQLPAAGSGWRTSDVFAPSFPNGIFLGSAGAGPRIFYGTAAPASGTHARGDIYLNLNAAVGAPAFWQCVAAGTPGTWGAGPNLV